MGNWIDDNKGQAPWDLIDHKNKFGFINNKRWSEDPDVQEFCEDIGLSLDPENKHVPCGHWHKAPLVSYSDVRRGDTTGQIDQYEYDTVFSLYNFFVHVTGNVYAVMYFDQTGTTALEIKTVEIDSSGNITNPNIDQWTAITFPPFNAFGGFLKLASSVSSPFMFAVFYSENTGAAPVWLKTFSINSDGTINKSFIDTQSMGATNSITMNNGNFDHVTGNIYTGSYVSATTGHGRIVSFNIAANGTITVLDEISFYVYIAIWMVGSLATKTYNSNTICVSYNIQRHKTDPERHKFYLATISCDGAGNLVLVDSYLIRTHATLLVSQYTHRPRVISGFSGIALNYIITGATVGKIKTFGISNGIISLVDTKESWGDYNASFSDFIYSGEGDVQFVTMGLVGSNGLYSGAISIDSSGTIGELVGVSTIDPGLNAGSYSKILEVGTGVYATAYTGVLVDGFIATFGATTELVRIKDSEVVNPFEDEPQVWPMD